MVSLTSSSAGRGASGFVGSETPYSTTSFPPSPASMWLLSIHDDCCLRRKWHSDELPSTNYSQRTPLSLKSETLRCSATTILPSCKANRLPTSKATDLSEWTCTAALSPGITTTSETRRADVTGAEWHWRRHWNW